MRLIRPSDQIPGLNGGLGKLQFDGGRDPGVKTELTQILADVKANVNPDLAFLGTVRYMQDQKFPVDVMEAYVRYRPVTSDDTRWSVRVGAFYPPISLENEGIGWSSPWTITYSAINSWIGEELRTLGAEGTFEWKFNGGSVEAFGSVFGWNDPTGVLLAERGWGLNDRPVGLFDRTRVPNAFGIQNRLAVQQSTYEFMEIDDEAGWYAGVNWRQTDLGRLSIMRYEDRADPAAKSRGIVAWRTDFTSVGLETYIGDITILAQAISGFTEFVPFGNFHNYWDFQSAFVLVGWDIGGDWRAAIRAETFATQNRNTGRNIRLDEHGSALTIAGTWKPYPWFRLTAEAMGG